MPNVGDDWTLTTDQMIWMIEHHNTIDRVVNVTFDFATLQELMDESGEYIQLFGDMPFDEALDRYENMLDE